MNILVNNQGPMTPNNLRLTSGMSLLMNRQQPCDHKLRKEQEYHVSL